MNGQEDLDKLGFSHSGLVARSPEGHAARGMAIKGEENLWVGVQKKTFTNWVNEQLRQVGMEVTDLQYDLCDGLKLVALIEVLQKRKLKKIAKPINHHQFLENVQTALNAITKDGIKLVNIGNTDIVDGNLKLILGLIWSLIVHYQIGRSRFPPKKLMLAWLKAALPKNNITNLTSSWNSGINLCALLNYCKPSLFPDWQNMDPNDKINNCHEAMRAAKKEFNIPMILTPDDLASRNLDELSGMTYLSYFMRPESPGYFSSLNWIRKQVPHLDVRNFTTDWNDGITLCHLSRSLGAPIKGFSNLNKNQKYWEHNQELGIKAGKHLGVESILTAKEMTEKEVDYLGIMAYASAFQWVSPQKPAGQRISITGTDLNNCHVNKKAHFKINLLDVKVDVKRIRVDIKGPSRDVKCALDLAKSGCSGEFTPFEDGTHELIVYYDDEVVEGCPMNVKVHPDLSKIMFSGIDPCAIGSIVEVLINSKGAGGGAVRVDATAPSDKIKSCPVSEEKKGIYMAKFSPNEIGEWKIAVTYSGQHIHGSPFTCYVYDPAKVKLIGLDPGLVNEDLRFVADANQAGWGDIKIEVSHAGRDVPCQVDERGNGEYWVIFRPRKVGRHKVHVTYNGIQVKGSPFGVEVFDNRESLQVYHERNKHKFSSSLKVDRNKFETTSKDKIDLEGRSNFDFSNQRRFEINRADNIDGESRNGYSFTKNGFTESKWSSEFSHSQHDSNKVQIRKQAISDTKPNRHYFGFNSDNDQNSTDEYVAKPPEVKPKPTNYVSRDDYHGNSQGKGQFQEIKTKATDYRSRQRFPSDIKGHRHDSFSPSREDREPTRTNSGLNSSHSALFGNSKNERTHFRSKYNLIEDSDHENKQPKYPFQSDIMKHKRDSSVDNREPSIKSKTESVLNQARSPRNQMNMLMQDELKLRSQEFRLRNEERLASEKTEIDASVRSGYKIPTNLDKIRISGEEDLKLLRVRTTGELMLHGDLSLQPEDIKVIISAPNMKQLPVNIYSKGPSMYKIEFVPLEVGEHIVELFIQGNRMESNIKCFVFDSDKIKVGHIPNGVVGKSIEFEIDGSNAGSGNLEILVNGGHVTSQVRNLGNHKFLASFIPHSAMTHSIEMKFNGRPVPGSPWSCEIRDSSSNIAIRGEGIKSFSCERPTSFDIIASDCKKDDFEVIISTPSNKRVKHRLLERPGNRFSVEFRSAEVGIHTIDIALNRQEISGSPFLSKAYNASLITVSPIDEILLNEIYEFTVDASLAGEGQLEISINDGEVPNEVQVVGGGKCIVMFTPELAETHKVDIHFNGESVPGSPFICRVVESFSKNQNSHFSHESKGHFRNRIKQTYSPGSSVSSEQISIAQDSSENSSFVSHLKQDTLEFDILDERGKFDEKNLDTSISSLPSSIESSGSKRTFPKISISNSNVDLIPVGRLATFDIHFDQGCEINLLNVTIKTPSNKKLPVKIANLGKTGFSAEFTPKEVGPHDVTVEYGNLIVSGSPFTSNVFDAKKVLIGDIPNGTLNDPLKFSVDASRCGEGNLEITVTADENNVATEVDPLGNAKFMVSFIPIFDCDHIIDVSFNEHRVPGSPFCSRLLKAENNDSNQSSSSFNKTSSFTISNISGNISDFDVKVLDPKENTIAAEIKQNLNGLYKVDFLPRMTGEYKIMVDLHGSPVSGSPFVCKVYDAGQIKVRDIPKGYVGKPVTFLVETESAGPGNLEVSIDGGQVPTTARTQAPNLYAITFTPEDKHLHIIDLKFNGEPVPDNPFTCSVMESPPKVSVSGDGLEKVAVNRPASFIVDPSRSEDLQLLVNILSPTRQNVPVHINGSSESLFRVEYTPTEVGDHTIEVTYGDMVVTGSPFLVKAYDPAKVKVTDVSNGTVGKPVYFSIDASQAGAGNLEIIVSVNGRNVPNYVQSEGNAKFRVHFKPTEVQQHILSVKFNGEPVPGSPYFCQITDTSSNYVVSGASLRIASVLKESKFTIDTRGVSKTDSKILITAPSGKLLPSNVEKNDDKFDISFTPVEVGPHMIIVTLDGESVSGSPFTCNVYDVNKINITGLNPTEVGKPITFQVDASQAGEGTLELVVTTQKTSVRAEVAAKSRGLYDVTFTPQDITPHFVNITFNDEKVPGAPFKCDVLNESNDSPKSVIARGEGLKQGLVGAPGIFEIDAQGLEGKLDIRVVGPGEAETPSSVSKTPIGTYKAEYNAKEVGTYKIEVYHGSKAISSKPFLVEVCDPSRVKVLDIKDGLQGHEQSFRVDTTRAGRGHLEAKITSSSGQEVKSMIREIGNGHHEVLWTPVFALPHKINVTYNSHSAPGCPIDVSIKDSSHSVVAMGTCLRTSSATKPSTFVINTKGFGDAKDIDVIITGPKDSAIPVKCYQQNDGNLLAEFTPINTGAHKIEILHENKPIPGSPYLSQVFDASKIKIQKLASTSYKVHQTIAFSMSRKDAGYAELDVTVTSPLGKNLPFEVKGTPDGEGERIEFTPTVAGKYKIAIKYGGNEVPGSPITFMVEEPGIPKVYGDGLISGMQDEAVTFKIDVQGLVGEPHVQVDGPDSVAKCTLEEESDGMYLVTYIPREVGLFDIRIFWNGKEVNGSPFHPKITNPSKVRVIGGLESLMDEQSRLELILGEEKRIPFDVSEAGPGRFRAEVRGPSGMIESLLEQTNVHRYKLSFTPTEEGEFFIYLYYADSALPRTPYVGYAKSIGSSPLDHTRVVLRGQGIVSARVSEEAEFIIDGSEAGPGSPEISMGGVKADITVTMVPQGNNVYRANYTPTISGSYLLNVMWSDRQVKGCPLKVSVTASADASKVICSGDGLRGGQYGKEIKSYIDTRRAGPGELTAQCVGPHKVAYCELYDHRDGTFTLYVKPQEGGRHVLTIKYGGEHVEGSPFNLRIAGPPDASKVRVYGPGIEPGVLATYQSRFISDTRGAGAGQLTVRIRGPKGAFRVEMQRESQKDRTILCKYDPTEPGDYRVEVKWSGEHVPGSPFLVMIFDTQDELNRYLQGPGNTATTPNPEYTKGNGAYGTSFGQMSWKGSQTLS